LFDRPAQILVPSSGLHWRYRHNVVARPVVQAHLLSGEKGDVEGREDDERRSDAKRSRATRPS
jgi:hypothetical protein